MKTFKRKRDIFVPTSFIIQRDFSEEGLAIVIPKNVVRALRLKAGDEIIWQTFDEEGNVCIKVHHR